MIKKFIFYDEVEIGIQGINVLVEYFLFFALTHFKQIERCILYKLVISFPIFCSVILFIIFGFEYGKWLESKLFFEDIFCLILSKFLFLPNNDL